jgi:hypothetical protein
VLFFYPVPSAAQRDFLFFFQQKFHFVSRHPKPPYVIFLVLGRVFLYNSSLQGKGDRLDAGRSDKGYLLTQ